MKILAVMALVALSFVPAGDAASTKKTSRAKPEAPKAAPVSTAPATIPHTIAMFLTDLSQDGRQKVSYRATAFATRLFVEMNNDVTVYTYNAHGNAYAMEAFLPSTTLEAALRKYGSTK